jgi:hypothetical protein
MLTSINSFCQQPANSHSLESLPPALFIWDNFNQAEAIVFGPQLAQEVPAQAAMQPSFNYSFRSSYFR